MEREDEPAGKDLVPLILFKTVHTKPVILHDRLELRRNGFKDILGILSFPAW